MKDGLLQLESLGFESGFVVARPRGSVHIRHDKTSPDNFNTGSRPQDRNQICIFCSTTGIGYLALLGDLASR